MVLSTWITGFKTDNGILTSTDTTGRLLRSVNSVIRDMNERLGYDIDESDDLTETIAIPAYAENAFYNGVLYYAQRRNTLTRKFDVNLQQEYEIALGQAMSGALSANTDLTVGYVNAWSTSDD